MVAVLKWVVCVLPAYGLLLRVRDGFLLASSLGLWLYAWCGLLLCSHLVVYKCTSVGTDRPQTSGEKQRLWGLRGDVLTHLVQ